ncbi:hypothetical protein PDE_04011 [Penicillium oxalicum 114-2]|uniref:Uncharacterized protein n=1 Tax=Penicillium oxalicum (strain 114-2 / CGMCC 5302) TaxID=933388 RepID=S7ZFK2_PENO1|nr:hypothetical protein PDE_04011 [Penicillium oxalicum 114-2]
MSERHRYRAIDRRSIKFAKSSNYYRLRYYKDDQERDRYNKRDYRLRDRNNRTDSPRKSENRYNDRRERNSKREEKRDNRRIDRREDRRESRGDDRRDNRRRGAYHADTESSDSSGYKTIDNEEYKYSESDKDETRPCNYSRRAGFLDSTREPARTSSSNSRAGLSDSNSRVIFRGPAFPARTRE